MPTNIHSITGTGKIEGHSTINDKCGIIDSAPTKTPNIKISLQNKIYV